MEMEVQLVFKGGNILLHEMRSVCEDLNMVAVKHGIHVTASHEKSVSPALPVVAEKVKSPENFVDKLFNEGMSTIEFSPSLNITVMKKMIQLALDGKSVAEIASRVNVSDPTARRYLRLFNVLPEWNGGEFSIPKKVKAEYHGLVNDVPKKEKITKPRSKVSDMRTEIRKLAAEGCSQSFIMRTLGVTRESVLKNSADMDIDWKVFQTTENGKFKVTTPMLSKESVHSSTLPPSKIAEIRTLASQGKTQFDIAQELQTSRETVRKHTSDMGINWLKNKRKRMVSGCDTLTVASPVEKTRSGKHIANNMVTAIREFAAEGMSKSEIRAKLGVSYGTISNHTSDMDVSWPRPSDYKKTSSRALSDREHVMVMFDVYSLNLSDVELAKKHGVPLDVIKSLKMKATV